MNILNSASKIVLLLITIALIFLTIVKTVESKDFMMVCAMVMTYYFTKSPAPSSALDENATDVPQ